MPKPDSEVFNAEPNAKPNAKHLESKNQFRHLTPDDLNLIRAYQPDFLDEVDRAMLAQRPIYLHLDGYDNNKDIIAACLWYALDHGVRVVITTHAIEKQSEMKRRDRQKERDKSKREASGQSDRHAAA